MKKFRIWMAAFLSMACLFTLTACSQSAGPTSAQIQEGVTFSLVDVLKTENKQANTVFYYFLASVDNESDSEYYMDKLSYVITDRSEQNKVGIHPIDQFKTTITNAIKPGYSTFVYGYIGVPATKHKNMGLYLPAQDQFIQFDSVRVRTIDDEHIVNSSEKAFTIYDDEYFEFDVDASNMQYRYDHGKSVVDGLKITYRNKTDDRLVIPYLSPVCTIDGLDLDKQPDPQKLKDMSQEEIEKQDFSSNGLAARTESFTGKTLGYQLFYLPAKQEVTCDISFEFENVIPDFSAAHNAVTVNINSPALGYSQIMKVEY